MTSALGLYDRTRAELQRQFADWGVAATHAESVWKQLYRDQLNSVSALSGLPRRLEARLQQAGASLPSLNCVHETETADGLTRKFLLELVDGQRIETVLMHCRDRVTACLSTQAGCALGCVFCATGQLGFSRNLSAGEIVGQAVFVDRFVRRDEQGLRLRNLVLMGMGEPLLNYEAVIRALEILRDSSGMAIATKRITLSTVGVVPGIRRLADEAQPYSLAVSLHAATQAGRAALLPAARTWPLDELLEACRYYATQVGRRILFEWTLIAGENDSAEQALALARLLAGISAQVNLIPLNATAGYEGSAGSGETVTRFQAILREQGLPTTVRRRRGIEITAGCGQLANSELAAC